VQDQETKLREEIVQDAQQKAERLVKRASRDARKMLDAAREEREKRRVARVAEAELDVEQRVRAVLATVGIEIRRRRLAEIEVEITKVLTDAVERALALPDEQRRASLLALLSDAAGMMGRTGLRVLCSSRDRALLTDTGVRDALQRAWGGTGGAEDVVFVETDTVRGGLIVDSADERRRVDNSYDGRLARMKDELRTQVYRTMAANAAVEGDAER